MTFLQRLRGEAQIQAGELELPELELRWGALGVELIRDGKPPEVWKEGELFAIQLSCSRQRAEPTWIHKLLRRKPRLMPVLHAELRGHRGLRVKLDAKLPSVERLRDLPGLRMTGGVMCPFSELVDLLETSMALGAHLAEAHAGLLHSAEALQRTRLEEIYGVHNKLVHIPFAEVGEVSQIQEHDNADRLEIARVAGLTFVVGKGSRKRGDRVVYLRAGVALPKAVAEALGIQRYLKRGKIVRVVLRGVASEGLLLNLDEDIEALTKLGASVVGTRAQIEAVEPHPKLNAFDLVTASEATCVVRRGTWKVGEKVLLFHAGTVLPVHVAERYGWEDRLGIGHRVRYKNFKGVTSQGLLAPDRL